MGSSYETFVELAAFPERLERMIRAHPHALALYEEVCGLYGKKLHIQAALGEVSSYVCPFNPDETGNNVVWPPSDQPAITIAQSGRQLEAACHELLHLRLPGLGYAKFCHRWVAAIGNEHADRFRYAINQIEHQVMFPQFLQLGFAGERFLVSGGSAPALDREYEDFRDPELIANPMQWSDGVVSFFSRWPCAQYLKWAQFRDGSWVLRSS